MLVMRRMNNPAFATVLAVSFLLHPALAQTNLENYHPDSFLIPVMGFVLYAAIENKPRMLVVFSVLALLCKEDVVLILLPLLIWFGLRRNLRLGIVLAFGSIATAAVMTYVGDAFAHRGADAEHVADPVRRGGRLHQGELPQARRRREVPDQERLVRTDGPSTRGR